jgi:hypothetical protein
MVLTESYARFTAPKRPAPRARLSRSADCYQHTQRSPTARSGSA